MNQMGSPKAICSLHHLPAAALLRIRKRLAGDGSGGGELLLLFYPAELLIPDADVTVRTGREKWAASRAFPQRTRTHPFPNKHL